MKETLLTQEGQSMPRPEHPSAATSHLLQESRDEQVAESLEARVRIELTRKGFADLSLTTWVPRRLAERMWWRCGEVVTPTR